MAQPEDVYKRQDEHEIICYDTRTTDVDELGRRGKDADIIAIGNLPFPREVLEKCKKVRMLAVAFTGLDHVDLRYCEERGIRAVSYTHLKFGIYIENRAQIEQVMDILDADENIELAGFHSHIGSQIVEAE